MRPFWYYCKNTHIPLPNIFFEINEQKKCFKINTTLAILELFKTNHSCGITYILHAENVVQQKTRVRSIRALNKTP